MQGYAVQHPSDGGKNNIHLKALYNKAQYANTEIQEEKQRQEKSQDDTQSLLEELLKRNDKLQAIIDKDDKTTPVSDPRMFCVLTNIKHSSLQG